MMFEVSLAENESVAKVCTTAIHTTTQSHASAILLLDLSPGCKSPPVARGDRRRAAGA
jgi:hypothetical protein